MKIEKWHGAAYHVAANGGHPAAALAAQYRHRGCAVVWRWKAAAAAWRGVAKMAK